MAKQPRSLSGKVVAITGGARGIGRATAEALLREGARVGIGDIDGELAERTASELGDNARAYPLNVTDRASFEAFVDGIERDLGPLDVMVNNAGIMPIGRFAEEDDATTARQVDINLHGVILGTKIALRRMLPRRTGHIVNIGSGTSKAATPGIATYSATKHAVYGLTDAVSGENRDSGLDFSVVMPVVVKTELGSGIADGRGVKRIEPEDVADAIVDALKFPRFDVYVPRSIGHLLRGTTVMPRRLRYAIARALKADRFILEADQGTRRAYEERIARAEPGREPESETKDMVHPPTGNGAGAKDETEVPASG